MESEQDLKNAREIRTTVVCKLRLRLAPDNPDRFLGLRVSLRKKYLVLDIENLIKQNAKTSDWGQRLLAALDYLYSIGLDLMKPEDERKKMWDYISFADHSYLTYLMTIQGHMKILNLFGYSIEASEGLLHQEATLSLEGENTELLGELFLARAELCCFLNGNHVMHDMICRLVPSHYQPKRTVLHGTSHLSSKAVSTDYMDPKYGKTACPEHAQEVQLQNTTETYSKYQDPVKEDVRMPHDQRQDAIFTHVPKSVDTVSRESEADDPLPPAPVSVDPLVHLPLTLVQESYILEKVHTFSIGSELTEHGSRVFESHDPVVHVPVTGDPGPTVLEAADPETSGHVMADPLPRAPLPFNPVSRVPGEAYSAQQDYCAKVAPDSGSHAPELYSTGVNQSDSEDLGSRIPAHVASRASEQCDIVDSIHCDPVDSVPKPASSATSETGAHVPHVCLANIPTLKCAPVTQVSEPVSSVPDVTGTSLPYFTETGDRGSSDPADGPISQVSEQDSALSYNSWSNTPTSETSGVKQIGEEGNSDLNPELSDSWMENELRCQHCQFINLSDAELCISCAEPLDSPAAPGHKTEMPGVKEGTVLCPVCTFLSSPKDTVCNMCFNSLETNKNHSDLGETVPQNTNDSTTERECPTCTFMNPGTTNICLMCYNSIIGKTVPTKSGYQNDNDRNPVNETDLSSVEESGINVPGVEKFRSECEVNGADHQTDVPKTLKDDNIYCPKCDSVCDINLGAFSQRRCFSCSFQFCDGCYGPYVQGCTKTADCSKDPHCHHPRDCIFYARKSPRKKIRAFLKKNKVKHLGYVDWLEHEAKTRGCNQDVLKDEAVKGTQLCEPYTMYLLRLIKDNGIDPAYVMTPEQLKVILRREFNREPRDIAEDYLQEFVLTKFPLH